LVFIALSVILLAFSIGLVRSSRIVSGESYIEIGPSDRIRELAGISAMQSGSLKLLARTSSGYLLLAPDGITVMYVRNEAVKGAWFIER